MKMIDVVLIIAAIAVVAVVIVWLVRLAPAKRREVMSNLLYALAVEAERLYGSKTGQAKKKQVIAWFYERYKWLAVVISQDKLSTMIDEVVASMNQWLSVNPVGRANLIGTANSVGSMDERGI